MAILGCDIADYQNKATSAATGHDIDFDAYHASGRRFLLAKATEGTGYVNKFMSRNRSEAHRVGLPLVGLYHFARPGKNAAVAEADHFLHAVGSLQPGEVAVLDIETNDGGLSKAQLGQWAAAWLDRVAEVTGRKPGLYSYLPFLQGMDTSQLVERAWLWVAAYSAKPPGSDRWPRWEIWQYTSTATVPGISGHVDDNKFRSDDLAELAALSGGTTPTTEDFMATLTEAEKAQLLDDTHAARNFLAPMNDHLTIMLEVLGAQVVAGDDGEIDVDKLAAALSKTLGVDVAKELAAKLSS